MHRKYSKQLRTQLAWSGIMGFSLLYSISVLSAQIPADSPSLAPEREVIVKFVPGAIAPPSETHRGKPDDFRIRSDSLRNMLVGAGTEEIARLIPTFKPEDRVKVSRTGEQVTLNDWENVYLLRLPSSAGIEAFLRALLKNREVIYAEPNGKVAPLFTPNDQYFYRQFALKNEGTYYQGNGTAGADINATQAWDSTTGSSNIKIAIVDNGMQTNHPDFAGRVSGDPGNNAGHGTVVAGIAAAQGNNSIGVAGVAWNVEIINEYYGTSDATLIAAIHSAINRGAHIFNNSYGLYPWGRYSSNVESAFADAYKMNLVAVAAMGNEYQGDNPKIYPAGFGQGIIAVGATTNTDVHADYSSSGDWIDVSAPGGGGFGNNNTTNDYIYMTVPYAYGTYNYYHDYDYYACGGYCYNEGTSFAAPHVSGIAALLLSVNSNLYNDDIEQIIRLGIEDVNSAQYPGWDQYLGTGRVNARKALDYLRSPYEVKQWTANGGSIVNSTDKFYMVFYSTPGLNDGVYEVVRHEVRKTVTFPQSFGIAPHAWGRGVATNGLSAASPNFGMGWCGVVSGSVTCAGATLRTYVYEVWRPPIKFTDPWIYLGWYPTEPDNVEFAYTALGDPPPAAPQNLTVTPVFSQALEYYYARVTWDANTESDFRRYRVHRVHDWEPATWYTTDTFLNDYKFEIDPAHPLETACYYVEAEDWSGLISGPSNQECVSGQLNKYVYEGLAEFVEETLPDQFALRAAHPNPFNPSTTIEYDLPEASRVSLTVYDVMGREVRRWELQESAGYRQLVWDGKDRSGKLAPAGVYVYRLVAVSVESKERFTASRKLVLMK